MHSVRRAVGALLLLLHGAGHCLAQSELFSQKPYNVDGWANIASGGKGRCTFAPKAQYRPPPSCPPPQRAVPAPEAAQLGPKFAPILYQHPLDDSWLTDPPNWMKEAIKYDIATWKPINDTPPEGAAPDLLLTWGKVFATRLAVPYFNRTSDKVSFTLPDTETLLKRAVIDPVVDGRLTGKVWYTVFRPYDMETSELIQHAYVFVYNYFYPWNGCSSQVLGTQVEQRKQGVEYIMCPVGTHEGDYEHVKVYVCEADLYNADPSAAIQRAQYSQHGWLPEFDCKADECTFEVDPKGARRLVTFAGLGSHSNWKHETPLYVYQKVKLNLIINMDGLYIGDRYKKGPVFYPDENNTRHLPYISEMTKEQQQTVFHWALFPGVWGATVEGADGFTLTCLDSNASKPAPCTTENPSYFILDATIRPKGETMTAINFTAIPEGNTVTGPLWRRLYTYNWEAERAAPIWAEGDNVLPEDVRFLCPLEANISGDTNTGDLAEFARISLKDYLAAVVGLVLAASIVTFAMILPILLVRDDKRVLDLIAAELAMDDTAPSAAAVSSGAQAVAGSAAGVPDDEEKQLCAPEEQVATGDAAPLSSGLVPGTGSQRAMDTARMKLLRVSHNAILRAFAASVLQPYLLGIWIAVGLVLYITGVVLSTLGVVDMVTALDRIYVSPLWEVLQKATTAVFIVFGVMHLFIILASLWVRPGAKQLCGCCCCMSTCCCECWRNCCESMRTSWRAHAVLGGLLAIEMNVTMLLFALGLMMWIARFGLSEICVFGVTKLFSAAAFLTDVCVDLSVIGIDKQFCGADLIDTCNVWSDLNVDYISFGAVLFMEAQAMFLVLATSNYVAMRTGHAVRSVVEMTEKAEEARHKRNRLISYFYPAEPSIMKRRAKSAPPSVATAAPSAAPSAASKEPSSKLKPSGGAGGPPPAPASPELDRA